MQKSFLQLTFHRSKYMQYKLTFRKDYYEANHVYKDFLKKNKKKASDYKVVVVEYGCAHKVYFLETKYFDQLQKELQAGKLLGKDFSIKSLTEKRKQNETKNSRAITYQFNNLRAPEYPSFLMNEKCYQYFLDTDTYEAAIV